MFLIKRVLLLRNGDRHLDLPALLPTIKYMFTIIIPLSICLSLQSRPTPGYLVMLDRRMITLLMIIELGKIIVLEKLTAAFFFQKVNMPHDTRA